MAWKKSELMRSLHHIQTTIKEDNMKRFMTIFLALIAVLALVSPLYAAGDYGTKSDTAGTANISAQQLEGMKVVSQSGQDIGEVKNANIDYQTGNVRFVTISRDQAGSMDREVAVPFEALRLDQQNDQVVLTVNEDKLDNVPQQAGMTDDEFQRRLDSHYGIAPAWEGDAPKEKNPLDTKPFKPTGLSEPGRYFPNK